MNSPETYVTSLATSSDITAIIELSTRVQAALTASGSLQIIGPLEHDSTLAAINEERSFVLRNEVQDLIGYATYRYISADYFSSSPDFTLAAYPRPWKYVHSVMLEPKLQGHGIGRGLFGDVVRFLEKDGDGGALVLDCWAGNEKLRAFYARCGCQYVATVREESWKIAVFVKALRSN